MVERARSETKVRPEESANGSQSIAAVERAIDVLLYFGEAGRADLGVTEIASELNVPKAAVHRILTSLRTRQLVTLDPASRRYMLGPAAVALGRAYLAKIDVRAWAASELPRLSAQTNETATLSVRHDDYRIYVDQVLPAREVRMEVAIGASYPLYAGGSSKAFLAWFSDQEIDAYLARTELAPLADKTIVDPKRLRRELMTIRKRGYALSVNERQSGAASVAAPVRNNEGDVVAVISVCGPATRLHEELATCTEALLATTSRLSNRLGYRAS